MEGSTGPPVTNPARSLPVQDSASVDDSGKRLVVDNSNHSHVFIDLSDPAPHHPQLTPICSPSENNPGSVPTVMVGTSKNEASTKVRTPASTRASDAANPEAKFDPRVAAAELKKKLLKDKSARDNSIRPLGEVSHTSAQPDKRSVSDSATPSTRVSHAPGGKPARDPVFAGAEDIVDLIKSFSRATNQDNQVQPMGKTTQPMGKTTQPIGKTTQPIGKTIQPGNSTVNVTHVNAKSGTSAASHHQKIPVIDSVPTGPSGKRGQRARTMQGRLSLQANHGDAVPGSSLSGVTNTPIRTGATQAATASADKSSTTDLRTTTSIPNKPKATVTQSGYHNGYGSIAQDKPPTSSSNLGRSNKAMDTTPAATPKQPNSTDGARGNNNVEEAQTMGATLAKLIEQDHELRDWLLYTGYFDMDARTKKLARYRMLAELEATEQRIKEEQERLAATRRKLLEEDGLDQSYRLDVQIPGAGHSMTPQTSTPSSPVTNVSSVKLPQGKQPSKLSEDTTTPRSSLKRGLGILDAEDQRSKMPRLDPDVAKDSKANGAEDIVQRADRDRGRDGNRDHPDTWRSRSRPFKRGESSHRHSSFGPLDDKYEKYDLDYDDKNYDHRGSYHGDTGRYDAYRGKGKRGFWRRSPSPRRGYDRLQVTDPKPIDLGGKGGQFPSRRACTIATSSVIGRLRLSS